jgi:DNA replication regulator SLD3
MDFDSTLDLNDHITFLESLVMSSTLIDKKYRDGVPTCISFLDTQEHSEDNADPATVKAKKQRTSKKMKPGKNGLYPAEDSLIRKWWDSHDDDSNSGAPGDSREERMKSRISQLRIRETQLQMIVILEVLALKPLASNAEDLSTDLPTALPTTETTDSQPKVTKSKKPNQLTTLIDVHIDRLCIWQSLALEEATRVPNKSQNADETINTASRISNTDNLLRDFCVEVIAPL